MSTDIERKDGVSSTEIVVNLVDSKGPLEQQATFVYPSENGSKSPARKTLSTEELKEELRGVERHYSKIQGGGRAPSGKSYSSSERRQVYQALEEKKKRLRRMLKLVELSDPLDPLAIEVRRSEFVVISGAKLTDEEADWRRLVRSEMPEVWGNEGRELVRTYFGYRQQGGDPQLFNKVHGMRIKRTEIANFLRVVAKYFSQRSSP